jgi:cobaltochelatase CobN
MTSIDKFIGTEFRSRYMNPTWIEGMKKEGYAGAGEMRSVRRVPVGLGRDGHRDGRRRDVEGDIRRLRRRQAQARDEEFFEKKLAVRLSGHYARMLETVRKGYWKADAATQKTLLEEYVASVNVTASAAPSTHAATRGCSSS